MSDKQSTVGITGKSHMGGRNCPPKVDEGCRYIQKRNLNEITFSKYSLSGSQRSWGSFRFVT